MAKSRIRGVAAMLICGAWLLCAGIELSSAQAPEEQPPTPLRSQVPRLPETTVTAEPDATPSPAPTQQQPSDPLAGSVLDGTIFSSPAVDGYRAGSSSTGTLLDVPDVDIPGTVSVVTEDLRRDQQALRFDDILRDIGGAVKIGDQFRPDLFILRGFEVRTRDFRKNGFADPTLSPRDFANVERVEVFKGPASSLYGAGQPAGVINLITKKPQRDPYYNATFNFGQFDLERYAVDATGALNDDQTLLYRINAASEERGSFRDFGFGRKTFVAPALTAVLDTDTTLTWEGEFLNDKRRFDTGVVAIGGDIEALPIDRFLGEPGKDFSQFHDYRQTLMLNHRINDDWTIRMGGYSLFYDYPSSGVFPVFNVGPLLIRNQQIVDPAEEEYHSAIANLGGEFCTGGLDHKFVLGTEQGWFISNPYTATTSNILRGPLLLNANDPNYLHSDLGLPDPPVGSIFNATLRQNRHGFYAQDLVELNRHWKALSGVRFDYVTQTFWREAIALTPIYPEFPAVETNEVFERWTPRVGLVYQPIPDVVSFYSAYAKSFDPPGGGARSNPDPLVPELGDTFEGGVKMVLTENLSLNVAGFSIAKQNVTVDRFERGMFTTSQIGEQRSRGVDSSLVGQLSERWSMVFNWTYADARLFDPEDDTVDGKRPRNVPLHTTNLWTRYNLLQRPDEKFGLALGLVHAGDRLGDFDSDLVLPSYTRWDGGVFYQRGHLNTAVYLENLFDTQYYTSSISALQVFPGAPFNARAQVAITY